VPESFTNPCAGYVDHPFLKTIQMKKTTMRSENELLDRVCLSRWSSCRSSDARRFRQIPFSSLPSRPHALITDSTSRSLHFLFCA
jgi:hypothetical protein